MAELAMTDLIETAVGHARLNVGHEIDPQGNLRAVERGLLYDTLRTVGDIGHNDIVGLIGCVAQEVALKYGLSAWQLVE